MMFSSATKLTFGDKRRPTNDLGDTQEQMRIMLLSQTSTKEHSSDVMKWADAGRGIVSPGVSISREMLD